MKVSVEYKTAWGEELVLVCEDGSHPMRYSEGGIWSCELPPGCRNFSFEVFRGGKLARTEVYGHQVPDGKKAGPVPDELRVCWQDASARILSRRRRFTGLVQSERPAGVAIPVFSLRSRESFGTGDFADLRLLVDWAAATGLKIIQLLPVNDSSMTGTWTDSYPYNANSTFALHPQYISLPEAGVPANAGYLRLRDKLNSCPKADYTAVARAKLSLLHKAWENFDPSQPDFVRFQEKNRDWLLPYSVFCCLRDKNSSADFRLWGDMEKYDAAKVEAWFDSHREEAGFHCFMQYHLDRQLRRTVEYAHSKGVALKGDLPIGISPTSVDAWCHPELFRMDCQAGAPPDFFSADGQNWGFPIYNWEKMAEDGYAWWKSRLGKMAQYFDAFRIDHILGFFRIWAIPRPFRSGLAGHFAPALPYPEEELSALGFDSAPGFDSARDGLFLEDGDKKGWWHPAIGGKGTAAYSALSYGQKQVYDSLYEDFFFHRHDDFWRRAAMRKLSALLDSTRMLACGEDLGMIPDCVPDVMRELGILSLEVQRMPKQFGQEFARPEDYPQDCVCTTGSHDTSTLRSWWQEDRQRTRRYWRGILGREGDAPEECGPQLVREIIRRHLLSPAMLCILPLQDWLAMDEKLRYPGNPDDERINNPAITPYFWNYRMHLNLEDLLNQKAFNTLIRSLLEESRRIGNDHIK